MKKILVSTLALGLVAGMALVGCSRQPTTSAPPTGIPAPAPAISTAPSAAPTPVTPVAPATVTPVPVPVPPPPIPTQTPPPEVQTELPLTVSQPVDGATLSSTSVTVKGQTRAGAEVFINDQPVTTDSQGNFSAPVDLDPGLNAIDVLANDGQGNQNESLILVNVDPSQAPSQPGPAPSPATAPAPAAVSGIPLKVTQPLDGADITTGTVLVKGQTERYYLHFVEKIFPLHLGSLRARLDVRG